MKKISIKRWILCILLSGMMLDGCVSYNNIHPESRALDANTLGGHHVYKLHQAASSVGTVAWWKIFHDAQLNRLITIALQDSPDMQMAESRVRAASAMREAISSTLWPSIDLNGSIQRQRFSETGIIPPPFNGKIFNIGDLGFNFNYEFDFWGKNRQALKARTNTEYAAAAELAESRLVISATVAQVYFQLLHDLSQEKIAREMWQVNQKIYDIVNTRMRQGVVSDIPVKNLLVNVEQSRLLYIYYQQHVVLSRNQLIVLLGKNPLTTSIESNKFTFHPYVVMIPKSLPANLLAHRPDIIAARFRVEAAANEINVAKTHFYPNLDLSALYSYQSVYLNSLFSAQNRNNAISAAIDLPIFDAGARRANLKEKDAEFDLAVNEYNKTILNALHDVADQIAGLHAVQSELNAQTISYNAIAHNYQLSEMRYHNGIADAVQLLQNKNLTLQQQSDKLNLQIRYAQTVVLLLKALGGMDA